MAMNLLACNYWGLGNHCAVDELSDLVQEKDLGTVFLSTTWSTKKQMGRIRDKLN